MGQTLRWGIGQYHTGHWNQARRTIHRILNACRVGDRELRSTGFLALADMDARPMRWLWFAIAEDPQNRAAWIQLAERLAEEGRFVEASAALEFGRRASGPCDAESLAALESMDPSSLDDWRAVIPTRNGRPESLRNLVKEIGAHRTVIVHTVDAEESPDIEGCRNIRFEGPINIHQWWNTGIEATGARFVALVNDDTMMRGNVIPLMVWRCWKEGRDIARLYGSGVSMGWSGFFFMIDRTSGLMPDARYMWWGGDADLFNRAVKGRGIAEVFTDDVIHVGPSTRTWEEPFHSMIEADLELYYEERRIAALPTANEDLSPPTSS